MKNSLNADALALAIAAARALVTRAQAWSIAARKTAADGPSGPIGTSKGRGPQNSPDCQIIVETDGIAGNEDCHCL